MLASWVGFLLAALPFLAGQADQSRPTQLELAHRIARHFPDRPPVQFEAEPTAEHGPRIVITNLHQYALTALVIKREPAGRPELPQTIFLDALTRSALLAPVPRGLSFIMSVGSGPVGGPPPNVSLVAAIWEDGSTYGADDLLAEIAAGRKATEDMYRRSVSLLERGLDEHWDRSQYISAAEDLGHTIAPVDSLHWPETAPPRAVVSGITATLNANASRDPGQKRFEAAVKSMIVLFKQNIDALQEAAGQFRPTSERATP